jgi:hypothetical protein
VLAARRYILSSFGFVPTLVIKDVEHESADRSQWATSMVRGSIAA